MKVVKVIIGLLLLYAMGSEYASASNELNTFFSLGVISAGLPMIFLCAWLIGSGISKEKLKIKSWKFVWYFLGSLVLFSFYAISGLGKALEREKDKNKEVIEVNGTRVPLNSCLAGNMRTMPNFEDRRKYCTCIATKISNMDELTHKYKEQLRVGKIEIILDEIKNDNPSKLMEMGIQDCFKSLKKIEWTKEVAESMKKMLKQQLEKTEFEQTNDIDSYCDCFVTELRKYPLNIIADEKFSESALRAEIDSICTIKSIR